MKRRKKNLKFKKNANVIFSKFFVERDIESNWRIICLSFRALEENNSFGSEYEIKSNFFHKK